MDKTSLFVNYCPQPQILDEGSAMKWSQDLIVVDQLTPPEDFAIDSSIIMDNSDSGL